MINEKDLPINDIDVQTLVDEIRKGEIIKIKRSYLDLIPLWIAFAVICLLIFLLTALLPESTSALPFQIFLPLALLGVILHKRNNRRAYISQQAVSFVKGVISLQMSEEKVVYNNIRAVEVRKNILQRLFNVGDLCISTLMIDDPEIILPGVRKAGTFAAVIHFFVEKALKPPAPVPPTVEVKITEDDLKKAMAS